MCNFLITIQIPGIYTTIIRNLNKQRKFISANITQILAEVEKSNDGTLSSKDFLKINGYYGLAVPSILGEAFCKLRGKDMTNPERWVSTSQGIITGLFDDFFDEVKLSDEYLVRMINEPQKIVTRSSNEKLFIDFYLKVLSEASFPGLIIDQFMSVYKDQKDSVEQENKEITVDRIWEITQNKGGDSVLFYRAGFNNTMEKGEREALFQLGALMQLENDIFDLYKDWESKINTLVTRAKKVIELRNKYIEQMDLFIELSYEMNYPKKQIKRFLNLLMPVINRGFVCLDQYKKLEELSNNSFSIESYSRKQLICDMEKPMNILSTIKYQIKNCY